MNIYKIASKLNAKGQGIWWEQMSLPDWNCCNSISSSGGFNSSSYLATACLPDSGMDAPTGRIGFQIKR